jgi:two-component system, cell cycle sensor histidine kinase and response regulator CckA
MSASPDERELERRVAELEAALRRSDARFRALVEHSSDVTAIVDGESRLHYVSPSVTRILGYEPEELVGAPSLDVVHPEDRERVAEIFARGAAESRGVETDEFRALHKDGSWRLIEATGVNLLDDPAVAGMVMTARDVTERRALSERLRQVQQLEAVGQLAGGVAHDFNNVLLVIRGYASVLRSSLADPQQIEDVDEITRAADRAADLTRQLLAFGRRRVAQPRMVGPGEIVSGIEKLLRHALPENIELVVDVPLGVSPIYADPTQIEELIVNLVFNARDAIDGPGTIAVSVGEERAVGVATRISPPLAAGDYVTLAVADTGSGVPDDVLPHIFEPFFSTKEAGVGSGLGLSTVYGIAAQAGGGIDVTPRLGGGTQFTVHLPVASGAIGADAWAGAARTAAASDGTETILLVEDEDPVRELVRRVLENAGYTVLAAARPSAAEELVDGAGEIDLLLSDVVMPEMSGYDLARRVGERRPGIRMLFISGYAHRASGEEIARGRLLKKPFAPEQLTRAVRAALDGAAAEEAA